MGKVNPPPSRGLPTKDEAIEILRAANPRAPLGDVVMYVAAFSEWQVAAANIAEHGTIVAHPRTAAPIENPYIKVRAAAMAAMHKLQTVRRADALWALVPS